MKHYLELCVGVEQQQQQQQQQQPIIDLSTQVYDFVNSDFQRMFRMLNFSVT
jgi:hypothetical protein